MFTDYEIILLNRIHTANALAWRADSAATQARIARKDREIDRLRALIAELDKALFASANKAF